MPERHCGCSASSQMNASCGDGPARLEQAYGREGAGGHPQPCVRTAEGTHPPGRRCHLYRCPVLQYESDSLDPLRWQDRPAVEVAFGRHAAKPSVRPTAAGSLDRSSDTAETTRRLARQARLAWGVRVPPAGQGHPPAATHWLGASVAVMSLKWLVTFDRHLIRSGQSETVYGLLLVVSAFRPFPARSRCKPGLGFHARKVPSPRR